jgi:hypothetical protein
LENAMRYVELNPVRAGLTAMPWDWPWSSARAHSLHGASDVVLDGSRDLDAWDYAGWKQSLFAGISQSAILFAVRPTPVSRWDRAHSSVNSSDTRGGDSRSFPAGAPPNP